MRTWPEPDPEFASKLYSQESEKYHVAKGVDDTRARLWARYARSILDMVEEHTRPPGRLLDVGFNCGDLLYDARKRGWDADGLEINKGCASHMGEQGFKVFDKPLEECDDIEDDQYDALVINQVLEHVHGVNHFLESIKRVLKPEGCLFVGVPAFWSPIPLLIQRRRWYAFLPDEHVWQFSKASLEKLLAYHDFRVLDYVRGCSEFWGELSYHPKTWARWCVYRLIAACKQGDFLNFVALNEK